MAKSNLVIHADRELRRAGLHKKDADYGGMLYGAVMRLVKVFAADGHSGGSAMITLDLFNRLARFQRLTALTNDPGEWMEVGTETWQSKRQPSCFSKDGGQTYYDINEKKVRGKHRIHKSEVA